MVTDPGIEQCEYQQKRRQRRAWWAAMAVTLAIFVTIGILVAMIAPFVVHQDAR